MKRRKQLLICLVIVASFTLVVSPQFLNYLGFPSNLKIIQGIEESLQISFPFQIYLHCDEPGQLIVNGNPMEQNVLRINPTDPILLEADTVGKIDLQFKLFGIIPIRHTTVDVLPEIKVYPGGHSIGVLLHADGIMVIENTWVDGADGRRYYPARDVGIGPGDYLLEINGKKLGSKQDVARRIAELGDAGQMLQIKVRKKNGDLKTVGLKPIKNQDNQYMVGLFIDDGVAGVGTMSFYEPESGRYGALGHVITDGYSHSPIQIKDGEIVNANISGIHSGQRGVPGEKLGTFMEIGDVMGQIDKNCDFGIYGVLESRPVNPYFKEPIRVATSRQIHRGQAWIYTVVKGGKIEKFAVEIEQISHQIRPATKGLVIRVTDQRLLQLTGGIIQGMSGSPIVQNGLLVGAVTHVFVENPKKGYGVLAQWMVQEAGLGKVAEKEREIAN